MYEKLRVIPVGFEVLTAVGLKVYNAMQSVGACRQYGETYRLLLQGRRMGQARDKLEAGINRSSSFTGLHDVPDDRPIRVIVLFCPTDGSSGTHFGGVLWWGSTSVGWN